MAMSRDICGCYNYGVGGGFYCYVVSRGQMCFSIMRRTATKNYPAQSCNSVEIEKP